MYTRGYNIACTLDNILSRHLNSLDELIPSLKLDYLLDTDLGHASTVEAVRSGAILQAQSLSRDRSYICARSCDPILAQELQQLKSALPNPSADNWEDYLKWWDICGKEWIDRFRSLISEKRKICTDWNLTFEQEQSIGKYYSAVGFLCSLLSKPNIVRLETRKEIESSLLMPAVELAKNKSSDYSEEYIHDFAKQRVRKGHRQLGILAAGISLMKRIMKKLRLLWSRCS